MLRLLVWFIGITIFRAHGIGEPWRGYRGVGRQPATPPVWRDRPSAPGYGYGYPPGARVRRMSRPAGQRFHPASSAVTRYTDPNFRRKEIPLDIFQRRGRVRRFSRAADERKGRECVAVYTRSSSVDFPYVDAWADHYLRLGVRFVIALQTADDPEVPRLTAKFGSDFLRFHRVQNNTQDALFAEHEHLARSCGCEWILQIDQDEFLLLSPQYKTIEDFIVANELNHGRIDAFQIHWMHNEHMNPSCSTKPLQQYLAQAMAWPDKRGLVKTLSRVSAFLANQVSLDNPHFPYLKAGSKVFQEGQITTAAITFKFPITEMSFLDHGIFHIHTRSLASMLSKALLPAHRKNIIDNTMCLRRLLLGKSEATYAGLVECLGTKAIDPLTYPGCWRNHFLQMKKQMLCREKRAVHEGRSVPISHLLTPKATARASQPTIRICNQAAETRMVMALLQTNKGLRRITEAQLLQALTEISKDLDYQSDKCCGIKLI